MPIVKTTNNDLSVEDFSQRFSQTFVKAKIATYAHYGWSHEINVVYIRDVKTGVIDAPPKGLKKAVPMLTLLCASSDTHPQITLPAFEVEIIEPMPLSRYVNTTCTLGVALKEFADITAFFTRIPDKQYKRGCCGATFSAHSVALVGWGDLFSFSRKAGFILRSGPTRAAELVLGELKDSLWSNQSITQLFNPTYPSFKIAAQMVMSTETNVLAKAFHQYYEVRHSFSSSKYLICRKTAPLAYISKFGESYLIEPIQDLFRQELIDLQRRSIITDSVIS